MTDPKGNSEFCSPRGGEGKQNSLFALGPVIMSLILNYLNETNIRLLLFPLNTFTLPLETSNFWRINFVSKLVRCCAQLGSITPHGRNKGTAAQQFVLVITDLACITAGQIWSRKDNERAFSQSDSSNWDFTPVKYLRKHNWFLARQYDHKSKFVHLLHLIMNNGPPASQNDLKR